MGSLNTHLSTTFLVLVEGYLTEEEVEDVLDPATMTERMILGDGYPEDHADR